MEPKAQAVLGAGIFTIQWWAPVLDAVHTGLTWLTLITGAVVGIHGVYRIFYPRA